MYFFKDNDLLAFVENLISKYPVIAPIAKRSRFVFAKLTVANELRLDYDTTILPPKKVFFPPKQDIIVFDGKSYKECVEPKEKILFGVQPHDIKGISMTDKLFSDNYPDKNYLANRNATIIVGSNVQNPYKHAFFASINTNLPITGHDIFVTKINDGFVVDFLTEKGKSLISFGNFCEATEEQESLAEDANQAALQTCPEKLNNSADEIQMKVKSSFNSSIWEELSKDCFSCGSCNIVCPTCYCFDMQDEWGLGKADGKRYRRWDGCLTSEFSEVTIQGGSENFREERSERYRHRFMRKAAYLNSKLGGPACIGCGRCSGACTADIANPVTTINKIMES